MAPHTGGHFWNSPTFVFSPIIATNITNYNIHSAAITAGWNGVTPITVNLTVNPGTYVYSTNTANAAIDLGAIPSGSSINIINYGYIMGMGGAGGTSGGGGAGGPAINITYPVSIDTSTGYILGGGGGGGAINVSPIGNAGGGGGGAGGGAGGISANNGAAGGSGGAPGASGTNGAYSNANQGGSGGGGGGRVVPSTTTAIDYTVPFSGIGGYGGSGGGTGGIYNGVNGSVHLGSGGGPGIAGTAPIPISGVYWGGGGGGGYGAAGGPGASSNSSTPYPGGAGGNAVVLNGNILTWINTHVNVYGAVA